MSKSSSPPQPPSISSEISITRNSAIYDWGHINSFPIRIFPPTPPPPEWCWGPLDVNVKTETTQSDITSEECLDTKKKESADDVQEEETSYNSLFAVDESSEHLKILEYNHGTYERDRNKRFLVNPLYKKIATSNSIPVPKLEVARDSDCDVSSVSVVDVLPMDTPPLDLDSMDPFDSVAVSKNGPVLSFDNAIMGKEQYQKKSITPKIRTKRKRSENNPSGLDSIIGQKLSKVRVATSSRVYAKPTRACKKNET